MSADAAIVHNASTYTNHDCRCDVCTAGNAARIASSRARRSAQVAVHGLPAAVSHGANAYCNWGCRCDVCRAGHAASKLARYHAQKQATS